MDTNSEHSNQDRSASDSSTPENQSLREPEPGSNRISRRRFARQVAAVAAAASLAPAEVFALPASPLASPARARKPQRGRSKLTPEQEAEVEAQLANIVRKYGDRLTEDQRQHLRRNLAYHQTLLAPVRAFPLEQGDSPAFTLKLALGKDLEKGGAS